MPTIASPIKVRIAWLPGALLLLFAPLLVAAKRPNIVIILADDMGFSDIGCYGSEIHTPNLDALATGGLRFTQFYNTARCCPTRAALLTGLHAHQAGVGHMMERKDDRAYAGDLHRNALTIAEVLRPAGYRSYAAGKWHVTPGQNEAALRRTHNWPLQRGFDRFYGTIHGAGSFWDPSSLIRDNRLITAFNDPEYQPAEPYHYTDAISDQTTRFIKEHARDHRDTPFFLYVTYTAAHWPMHAREDDIARYKGRYDAGYEAARQARWEKAKQLGVVDSRWPLSPAPEPWENVKDKAFEARCMEVYAAMVEAMDRGIGRIIAELKATGELDNTLICYLQDNGGCAEGTGRGPNGVERATAATLPPLSVDYQQQGSQPTQTRDGFPVRVGRGVLPGPADTYVGYGRNWANVSNTPFREYKHWQHEGGISTPFIAHWPQGLAPSRQGALEHQPTHVIDLMATCIDLARAKYPQELAGQSLQPPEGVSLAPVFAASPAPLRRPAPLFWEHEGNRAVRDDKWKLVSKHPGGWELYDLEADRTELRDLAAENPERVASLAAAWSAWAARVGVRPWPLREAREASLPRKPNVIFIAVDDLNHWVGHLGRNQQTWTPHLDRLARMGVTFTNAHCPAPVCNPSRAALLSGKRPGVTGVYDNQNPYRGVITPEESLVTQFKRAGYSTRGIGKLWHGGLGWPEQWDVMQGLKGPEPRPQENRSIGGINFAPLDCTDEETRDYQIAKFGVDELARSHDKPFFLVLGFHKPHMPWNVPRQYYDLHPLDQIELPPGRADDLDDVPAAGKNMAHPQGDHATVLKSGRWKEAVQAYLAAISYLDANVGRVLDALEKSPHRDNTIVCLWGDHGWHLGEKQHWRKFALWEEATRAPLLWIVPGITRPGTVCSRPVDFMSIYPTLCDLAGIPRPAHVTGESLRPLLTNPQAAWDRPALTTFQRNNHALRTERWRYIRYANGEEELYDHDVDPYEWTNLATRPEHAPTRAELAKWLPTENVAEVQGVRAKKKAGKKQP